MFRAKANADMKLYNEDVVLINLVEKLTNIESFNSLADVTPVMEDYYQKHSRCHVAICWSKNDKFQVL